MGQYPISQHKKQDKKYWKLRIWKKLTAGDRQQIIYDRNTWNLGRKNTSNNRKQETPTKYKMNWQIKQLQENINSNKKLLAYLLDGNDSNKNSMDPAK